MSPSRQQILKGARYLVVELFIVFVGVYLAFQLNEYRAEREAAERRRQLRTALAQEIDVFLLGADQLLPQLDARYADWRRRYEAGETPRPLYFAVGGADLPPHAMWEAVLASDGLAILPVASMQTLSDYYNALDILMGKYAETTRFAEEEIIPYDDVDRFYDPSGRTLRRPYAAYMGRVQDMLRLFGDVRARAERSKALLGEDAPAGGVATPEQAGRP